MLSLNIHSSGCTMLMMMMIHHPLAIHHHPLATICEYLPYLNLSKYSKYSIVPVNHRNFYPVKVNSMLS
jgi:hypothetical protein